jgi:hypothetical protein
MHGKRDCEWEPEKVYTERGTERKDGETRSINYFILLQFDVMSCYDPMISDFHIFHLFFVIIAETKKKKITVLELY